MFYLKCNVLNNPHFPEPVEIRGKTANRDDLENADVVVTNIQQLQGNENHWLQTLPGDFFDLILFDEGHHSVANSWQVLRRKFPKANVVNFSATPLRADGQRMAGTFLYSYSIFRATQEGYVKSLKALVLNPRTLRFVRKEDEKEIDVDLDEVRRLGEQDADFRRSIVTSTETLNTIADASIRELHRIRNITGDNRLQIIASALNYAHCSQIVEAYEERGLKAGYVHSKEDSRVNDIVLQRLKNHEIDVIVQVRKLSEGFDHPQLAVAAVFSIFTNLSPFVQFVGRIMRVIKQGAPGHELNRGSVIFHAGANVARRWEDFQEYSQSDQDFFDQFLPMENINFDSGDELQIVPDPRDDFQFEETAGDVDVLSQTEIQIESIPLFNEDPEVLNALLLLQEKGYTGPELREEFEKLEAIPISRVRKRQARRQRLDREVKRIAKKILVQNNLGAEGGELDRQHLGVSNFVATKSLFDRHINQSVNRGTGERHELTLEELEQILDILPSIAEGIQQEVFGGQN